MSDENGKLKIETVKFYNWVTAYFYSRLFVGAIVIVKCRLQFKDYIGSSELLNNTRTNRNEKNKLRFFVVVKQADTKMNNLNSNYTQNVRRWMEKWAIEKLRNKKVWQQQNNENKIENTNETKRESVHWI